MKEKIDELCAYFSLSEYKAMVFGKWARPLHTSKTTINYTFDIHSMSQELKSELEVSFPNITMSSLPQVSREKVQENLDFWRLACGSTIEFNYVPKLESDQPGITFVASDNIKGAAGITNYNFIPGNDNLLNQVLVCLPSTVKQRVYAHEIGHSLGFLHSHEIETLKNRLMDTPQGLGCSVMGYTRILSSTNNNCTTPTYCGDQPYAIFPGPMDREMCTMLYAFPPYSFTKYANSMFLGFLSGSVEKALSTYLGNVNFLKLSPLSANALALTSSSVLYGFMNGQVFNVTNVLAMIELIARNKNESIADLLQIVRVLSVVVTLFMQMYEFYANEDAGNNAIYLSAFLGSSLAGLLLASTVGKVTADLTNGVVDKISSIFGWGVQKSTQIFPGIAHKFGWFGRMFSKGNASEEFELEAENSKGQSI
ncbi:hypothetical protein [Legionella micdadei]|uniref:hypothetical protein n=1 Tax=Legionella micdadei TaxID=451 RepID=UPI0012EB345C|nr:hypothetical protein [Legionella micdadei]